MISLHANPMVLPVVIVGRATSRRNRETTMALGDRCQPGQGTLVLSPYRRDPDGRLDGVVNGVVRAFRRHSREVNGRQGKGAHVVDPRPWATMATRNRGADRHRVIVLVSCHFSNVDEVRVRQISNIRVLPILRLVVAVVVMFVVSQVVIRIFIVRMLYHHRRHQPWVVTCAHRENVILPTMMGIIGYPHPLLHLSQWFSRLSPPRVLSAHR